MPLFRNDVRMWININLAVVALCISYLAVV